METREAGTKHGLYCRVLSLCLSNTVRMTDALLPRVVSLCSRYLLHNWSHFSWQMSIHYYCDFLILIIMSNTAHSVFSEKIDLIFKPPPSCFRVLLFVLHQLLMSWNVNKMHLKFFFVLFRVFINISWERDMPELYWKSKEKNLMQKNSKISVR